MMNKSIYLDYAAGTPICDSALKIGLKMATNHYHNSQALYKGSALVADLMTDFRRRLALILQVKPENLMFCFGATNGNQQLINYLRQTYPQSKIACLNIDHDSVKNQADILLPVNKSSGQLQSETFLNLSNDICCLSLAGINNEVGIIQNFKQIKTNLKQIRQKRLKQGIKLPLLLHIDASQMALVHQIQPQALAEADFVTYNGAKFYSFRQSGLLYVKDLKSFKQSKSAILNWQIQPLMLVSGLTLALEMVDRKRLNRIQKLRQIQAFFEAELIKLQAEIVFKDQMNRSPHITTAIFKKTDNEALVLKLSQANICVGLGSACHSQTDLWQTSVLKHLGFKKEQIYSSVRFSFGYETTKTQLKSVIKQLAKILK